MGFFDKLTDAFSSNRADSADEVNLGGKQWDGSRWTVDGVPVTYRVTWRTDGGVHHQEEFSDIDQGYSFYEAMQKSANAYGVTWDHIPY